ncbi:MAG: CopD family protein [Bacteroidetes bacterium]|nr:CopD family protein [Bacteroidota bacterium]
MEYSYVKALHIVFVISWFAGLFYLVRLFIYAREAYNKDEPEKGILLSQFSIMQRKLLFIITWPAGVLTLAFGLWMLYLNPALLTMPWMWLKLIFVSLLIVYHLLCHNIYTHQKKGIFNKKSLSLRLFNELATVLMVAIVFLVVVKSTGSLVWGMLGLFIFAAVIMSSVMLYKKASKRVEKENKLKTVVNKEEQPEQE